MVIKCLSLKIRLYLIARGRVMCCAICVVHYNTNLVNIVYSYAQIHPFHLCPFRGYTHYFKLGNLTPTQMAYPVPLRSHIKANIVRSSKRRGAPLELS